MSLIVKVGADIKAYEREMRKLTSDIKTVSTKLENVGKSLTQNITVPLALMAGGMVSVGSEFEASMSKLQQATGRTKDEMGDLSAVAMDMGDETIYSAKDAADAMTELAKAGMDADETMAAIPGVLSMAAVENMDLAEAAKIVSSTLNGFAGAGLEAGTVADVLAKNSNMSASSVESLGAALVNTQGFASTIGMSFTDLNAGLGILSNAGYNGAEAGDKMNMMLRYMTIQTPKAQKKMDELGLAFSDANGTMKPLPQIIDEINAATEGMGDAQKMAALKTIFGRDAVTAIIPLLNAGGDAIRDYSAELSDSTGYASEAAATIQDNLKGSLERLTSTLETAAISIYQNVGPALADLTDKVTAIVEKFAKLSPETQKNILKFAAFLAVLGPIFLASAKVAVVLGKIGVAMAAAKKAFMLGKGAMAIFTAAMGGPVGVMTLIIFAVVAMAAAIIMNWDAVKKFIKDSIDAINRDLGLFADWSKKAMSDAWEAITTACSAAWEAIKSGFSNGVSAVTGFVSDLWTSITTWFSDGFNAIMTTVTDTWNSIKEAFSSTITAISTTVSDGWNTFTGYIKAGMEVISNVIKAGMDILSTIFEVGWNIIKTILLIALGLIAEVVFFVWNSIATGIEIILQWIIDIITAIWDAIGDKVMAVMDFIVEAVTSEWNRVVENMTAIFEVISTIVSDVWTAISEYFTAVFETIKTTVTDAWTAISTFISDTLEILKQVISDAWTAISATVSSVWESITNTISNAWDAISTYIWDKFTAIGSFIMSTLESIGSWMSSKWEAIKATASAIWESIYTAISNVWDSIFSSVETTTNEVETTVGGAWDSVNSKTSEIWASIKEAIATPINAAKDIVKEAIEAIKGFMDFEWKLPDLKMPTFSMSGEFSLNPPSVPKFDVSWFATGGIATGPSVVGIGEAGDEAILPLSNKSRMKPFANAVASMLPQNSTQATNEGPQLYQFEIPVIVDGRQIAKATAEFTKTELDKLQVRKNRLQGVRA